MMYQQRSHDGEHMLDLGVWNARGGAVLAGYILYICAAKTSEEKVVYMRDIYILIAGVRSDCVCGRN